MSILQVLLLLSSFITLTSSAIANDLWNAPSSFMLDDKTLVPIDIESVKTRIRFTESSRGILNAKVNAIVTFSANEQGNPMLFFDGINLTRRKLNGKTVKIHHTTLDLDYSENQEKAPRIAYLGSEVEPFTTNTLELTYS